MDLTYEEQSQLSKLIEDYKNIDEYVSKQHKLSYMQFDYAVVNDLTLFMTEPNFSFEILEQRLDVILNALPAIKRIFAQPFIHLKERSIILPVESVRIVNNKTLTHIASHSELWTDVKGDEIKPEKLLSRTYEDNYGIYENIVFCKVVDDVLSFARSNMRFLKELVYANQTIEFNLLERVNHLSYFLALGKLHIGYSRNFEGYYAVAVRCLNKLQFIYNSIVPRLKRPVYKKNVNKNKNVKLRKTNILSMHKEYHRIYKLALFFDRYDIGVVKEITETDIVKLIKNYFFFCQALCIFAVGHFNFTCNITKAFDLTKLSLAFSFKKWNLKLEKRTAGDWQVLELTVKKNKTYKVVLIPSLLNNNQTLLQSVKDEIPADEYIVCSPYEDHEKGAVLVDITNIESFRRLQQIILRAMIYSDAVHNDCPFCVHKLEVNPDKSTDGHTVYECPSCRTEIHSAVCPATENQYYYTNIAGLLYRQSTGDEEWLAKRKAEDKMYFRNITEVNDDLKPACPHCGETH